MHLKLKRKVAVMKKFNGCSLRAQKRSTYDKNQFCSI